MTTPAEVFDYDMATRARDPAQAPGDSVRPRPGRLCHHAHHGARRTTARRCRSRSCIARTARDGSAPLLLYGYGSYGMAMPASFSANRLSLVDRGCIYAIAHIRGGSDKGWGWYLDGKREKKTNTFTDFIAAAEHWSTANYTRPSRIVGHGGSAGGMLMGAVANRARRPVRRHHRRRAVRRRAQHHDRRHAAADAAGMARVGQPDRRRDGVRPSSPYSPYDNVAAKAYPPILAIGGLTDPRVTYWEPAKWVARLRATTTGGGPILLDQHGSRPRRRLGPLQPARRGRDRLRLRTAWSRASAGVVETSQTAQTRSACRTCQRLPSLVPSASMQAAPAFYRHPRQLCPRDPGTARKLFRLAPKSGGRRGLTTLGISR